MSFCLLKNVFVIGADHTEFNSSVRAGFVGKRILFYTYSINIFSYLCKKEFLHNSGDLVYFLAGYSYLFEKNDVPKDYISDSKKYQDPRYLPKSKDQLKAEVESFNKEDYSEKLTIDTYTDLEKYWEEATPIFKVRDRSSVIHVSDIHSHWTIVKDIILPKVVHKGLTIFLGDYIDGPNQGGSREVMEFIMREQRDNIIFLEGNHEQRLRKFLGWKALKGNKRIVSESLYSEIPPDFLEHTAKEFDDLTASDAWTWLDELNNKLHEFFIYERQGYRFICSHCGLKWAEQVCPKYVGSLLSTNRHIEKTDEFFSKRYAEKKIWSIHGHCHYSGYEFNKFPILIPQMKIKLS